jgi:hypothetical protein
MNKVSEQLPAAPAGRVQFLCWNFTAGFVLGCLLWAGVAGITGLAQPAMLPQAKSTNAPLANRWLIIVETSKKMRSRTDGIQQTIPALVYTGMNGQMTRGDTLGLWTYNDDLYAGQFPLQEWTPGGSQNIAWQVSDFLKNQKYEKDGVFSEVLPFMQRVVKSSDYLTILLVTDGKEKIHGTPFDNKINTFYKTWEKKQDKAHMPFITMLRAERGVITNCTMTIAPWPLEFPPLPPELLRRNVEAAQPSVPVQRVLPPLIIHGKKSEPEPAPAVPAAPAPATNASLSAPAVTNGTGPHDSGSVVPPAPAAEEKAKP